MAGLIDARKRVLIVDDSSTMRAMLDGILSNHPGFLVVGVARGAREAMTLIESALPQIILTDLCMPEVDGADLLKMLGDRPALCKVVISTRVNLSAATERTLAGLGAEAIFDKQKIARDPGHFLAALRRLIEKRAVAAPLTPALATLDDPPVPAARRFPIPAEEAARLRAVHALKIANLDADPRLNILARHVARLTNYPIAAINVIGADQLWIKAAVGVAPTIMARGDSICAHALCARGPTVITDALADARFADLPIATGASQLRAYVGAPIIARDGARLGMVCVADRRPRCPTQKELEVVTDVAALVASALQTPVPPLRSAA